MKKLTVILLSMVVLLSCKDEGEKPVITPTPEPIISPLPEELPKDTGGQFQPIAFGANDSPFGYYLYTPSGYTSTGIRFPVLIFLHGAGEIGNSQTDPSALAKVLKLGPPFLIKGGNWNPKYPMVVVSPQSIDGWWDPAAVVKLIDFISVTYRVDPTRIYITGLSSGGTGIYDLITSQGTASHIAAAVPIVGGGTLTSDGVKKAAGIPLWAFHGEGDLVITSDFDKAVVKAINDLHPTVPAKLTMYPTVKHEVWEETYDGTGMGLEDPAYDPFNMEIYTWMFQYKTTL